MPGGVVHARYVRLFNAYTFDCPTVFSTCSQKTGELVNYYYVYIHVNKKTLENSPGQQLKDRKAIQLHLLVG